MICAQGHSHESRKGAEQCDHVNSLPVSSELKASMKRLEMADAQHKFIEAALAFVQVWENSPTIIGSETGRALVEAAKPLRTT